MVVNLHFQFANQEPVSIQLNLDEVGNRRLHVNDRIWLNNSARRKISAAYKKAFHRNMGRNDFTFHQGNGVNAGFMFIYRNRDLYRIIIPNGRKKHLWTNGRRYVNRQERLRLGRRWQGWR